MRIIKDSDDLRVALYNLEPYVMLGLYGIIKMIVRKLGLNG